MAQYTRFLVSVVLYTYTVGETGRNLHTRLQEHKCAVANGDSKNGIAIHVMENDHKIQLEQAQVITNEPHLTKRKVKKSLQIKRTSNTMNLDRGVQLDHSWDSHI